MDLNNKIFDLNPSFIAVEKLGHGSYGDVFKVQDKASKKYYAIKVIKQTMETEGIPINALREITILKKVNHPNIIHLNQIHTGKKHIELCLDYCDFDLRKFKEKFQSKEAVYNELTILNIMYQLIQGMNYLHSKMIMHRDLKLQNILIDYSNQSPQVRIADFGLSRKYTIPNKQYTKEVATLWYKAPELLLGNMEYSIGIDIWSIGCIFAELYLNGPLFQTECDLDQLNKILKVFGTSEYSKLLSSNQIDMNYPQFRNVQPIGLKNFFNERNVIKCSQSCFDLIELMLQIDPLKRITCKDALEHECFRVLRNKSKSSKGEM